MDKYSIPSSTGEKNDVPRRHTALSLSHGSSKSKEDALPPQKERRRARALEAPFSAPLRFSSVLRPSGRSWWNDKTFLVFRRQASHSILSNFIRERRRTWSYIGRKKTCTGGCESGVTSQGSAGVTGVPNPKRTHVATFKPGHSRNLVKLFFFAQPCTWRGKGSDRVSYGTCRMFHARLPRGFNMFRAIISTILI